MILYSAIARGQVILVSHDKTKKNIEAVLESNLKEIPKLQDTKCTLKSDDYLFIVIVEQGITYLCAVHPNAGRLIANDFLQRIKRKFCSSLSNRARGASLHEFDSEFAHVLAKEMEMDANGESSDHLIKMKSRIDEVTGIMTENIEKMIDRGDKLDTLVDKAADLEASGTMFKGTARKVQRKMFYRNVKCMIMIGCVVSVALTIIILMATNIIPVKSKK